MLKVPCKDCPERSPTCHAKCEKYQEFNLRREELREARQKESNQRAGFIEHHQRLAARVRTDKPRKGR